MKKNNKKFVESEEMSQVEENNNDIVEEDRELENVEDVDLEAKIEELLDENQKLREDYLRAFADAENTKKRCTQEIEKNNKYATSSFAKSLLGVADNLQRALDAVKTTDLSDSAESLRQGIELTQAELIKAFDKFGIHKMDIMGQKFDPNFHQVIQEIESDENEVGTIIAELQTGYMINDRILREAMVVVAK